MKIHISSLCDPSVLDSTLLHFQNSEGRSITIVGPDVGFGDVEFVGDVDDEDDEPEQLPEHLVERGLRALSGIPTLREMLIYPSYYSSDKGHVLSTSRLSCLLSRARRAWRLYPSTILKCLMPMQWIS